MLTFGRLIDPYAKHQTVPQCQKKLSETKIIENLRLLTDNVTLKYVENFKITPTEFFVSCKNKGTYEIFSLKIIQDFLTNSCMIIGYEKLQGSFYP